MHFICNLDHSVGINLSIVMPCSSCSEIIARVLGSIHACFSLLIIIKGPLTRSYVQKLWARD